MKGDEHAWLLALERERSQQAEILTFISTGRVGTSAGSPQKEAERQMDRDQVEDIVAAAEARNETKLEKAMGEIRADFRSIDAKLSHLPTTWTVIGAAFGAALTMAALILAALAFGSDMFSRGFDSHDVAVSAAREALAARPAQK